MDEFNISEVLWEITRMRPNEVSLTGEGALNIPFLIKKNLISREANLKNKEKLLAMIAKSKLSTSSEDLKKMYEKVEDETLTNAATAVRILKAISPDFGAEQVKKLLLKEELIIDVEKSKDTISLKDHEEKMKASVVAEVAKAKKEFEDNKSEGLSVIQKAKDAADKLEGSVKDIVKSLITNNEVMNAKVVEISKSLQDEKDKAIDMAFEKQAAEFSNIKVDGLAKVMKSMATTDENSYKTFKNVLTVANKALGKKSDNSFDEIGMNRGDESNASNAKEAYAKIVDVAKSRHPNENESSAISKFLTEKEGRALYAEYAKLK